MNEEIINNEMENQMDNQMENENIEINDEQMENISGGSRFEERIMQNNNPIEITDDIRIGFD